VEFGDGPAHPVQRLPVVGAPSVVQLFPPEAFLAIGDPERWSTGGVAGRARFARIAFVEL
jgi:hypothetical protein